MGPLLKTVKNLNASKIIEKTFSRPDLPRVLKIEAFPLYR